MIKLLYPNTPFMKLNLTTLALLALVACQPSKTVETASTDLVDSTSDQSTSVTDEEYEEDTDGVMELSSESSVFVIETTSRAHALVSKSISVFSDSTEEAEELFQTENIEPVVINQQTTARYPLDGELCDLDFRYQIAFLNGHDIDGWVEGLEVILSEEEGDPYEINGTQYKLMNGMDSGIGPDNEDGLTGCNRYVIPYLYNEQKKTASFFTFAEGVDFFPSDAFLEAYNGRWMCFVSSDGGDAYIERLEVGEDGKIVFYVSVSYQEGGGKFTMEAIEESDGKFVITCVSEVQSEQMGE